MESSEPGEVIGLTPQQVVGTIVYLDQADLLDIADGKAAGLQDLDHTLSSTGATLQVSIAHLMDLATADADSCDRWLDAVSRFPSVEFAIVLTAA